MAGSLGYCGLDRKREPLAGDEIRACWEPGPDGAHLTVIASLTVAHAAADVAARGRAEPLDFIEIDGAADLADAGSVVATGESGESADLRDASLAPLIKPAGETGWSLWGDVER